MRLCYTCDKQVDDEQAKCCSRPYCAARHDVERDAKTAQGTRPSRHHDGVTDWTPLPFRPIVFGVAGKTIGKYFGERWNSDGGGA